MMISGLWGLLNPTIAAANVAQATETAAMLTAGPLSAFVGVAKAAVPGETRYFAMTVPETAIDGDEIYSVNGSVVIAYGTDANVANLTLGPAMFEGGVIVQPLGGAWVPNLIYRWVLSITTNTGQTPILWVYVPTQPIF